MVYAAYHRHIYIIKELIRSLGGGNNNTGHGP